MSQSLPVQWLKETIRQCLEFLADAEKEQGIKSEFEKLGEIYVGFAYSEKKNVHELIRAQLGQSEGIYVLSCILYFTKIKDFWKDVAYYLEYGNFDCLTGSMLEIQLDFWGNLSYSKMREIHRKNLERFIGDMTMSFPHLPLTKRNANRVVIITEQLLSPETHSPTKIVMRFAEVLKKAGYEVFILICPSNRVLPREQWINTWGYHGETERTHAIMQVSGVEVETFWFPMTGCNIQDYEDMLSMVYEWNPLFVLNMGVNNPVADLPQLFTTVAAMDMTIDCPVSEAEILIRYTRRELQYERQYEMELKSCQTQIFMEEKLPAIIEKPQRKYRRLELGLPQDKFLIAIVGNRLDTEINPQFMQVMRRILREQTDAAFVIIGQVEKLPEYLSDKIFQNRVYYLGYCRDLSGAYSVLDLYLNPGRLGGGWSGAIALASGLPVVTLPECDVAYNVGENFTVDNYEALIKEVAHYMTDTEFYHKRRKQAFQTAETYGKDKMEQYVTKLFAKIREALTYDSVQ